MKTNQSLQFTLLAAVAASLIPPAGCIHVQNTTQSSSTTWSNPETAATIIPSSELPSSSSPSSTTTKPTTTAKHIPFGMIIRESGAITFTWRRCGEGLSSSSTITTSSSSTETVTDLEVFPTVVDGTTSSSLGSAISSATGSVGGGSR